MGVSIHLVFAIAIGGALAYGAWRAFERGTLAPYVSTLVFFRFHFGLAGFLLLFPIVAQRSSLLHGLVVVESARAIAWVTAMALIAAWVLLAAAVLTFVYGCRQFGAEMVTLPAAVGRHRLLLASLLAVPTVAVAFQLSPLEPWTKIVSIAGGGIVAVLVRKAGVSAFEWVVGDRRPPFDLFAGTRGWDLQSEAAPPPSTVAGTTTPPVTQHPVVRLLGPGLAEPGGRIRSGHLAMATFLAGVSVLYWAGYWLLGPEAPLFDVPALGFVLLLLVLLTLILTSAAFVLDRLRVPVGLALIVASLCIYSLSNTDHLFLIALEKAGATPAPPPTNDVEPEVRPGDVVVVAAAGGGIQAAAWTARVLAGLQEDLGAGFARQIHFISAVSGGAVGSMYFVDAYTPHGPPTALALDAAVYAACSSSLSAVAWGVTYPDLLRVSWPFPLSPGIDRAWALEQSWRRFLRNPDATLSGWRGGVTGGWLPAVAFSATVAETGERLLLTTAAFPTTTAATFGSRYRAADVSVLRAARLAATFPYVTPMARAVWADLVTGLPELPAHHLGDGGYYDSLGISTVVDWLLQLKGLKAHGRRVLVVRIEPFPSDGDADLAGRPRDRATSGWFNETLGPVVAMMNVRSASQVARGDVELRLVRELLAGSDLMVTEAVFAPRHFGPLSWHLTADERRHIDEDWQDARKGAAMRTVLDWMGRGELSPRMAPPHCSRR